MQTAPCSPAWSTFITRSPSVSPDLRRAATAIAPVVALAADGSNGRGAAAIVVAVQVPRRRRTSGYEQACRRHRGGELQANRGKAPGKHCCRCLPHRLVISNCRTRYDPSFRRQPGHGEAAAGPRRLRRHGRTGSPDRRNSLSVQARPAAPRSRPLQPRRRSAGCARDRSPRKRLRRSPAPRSSC